MIVTSERVRVRFDQFLSAYEAALKSLAYEANEISDRVGKLRTRLARADFKLYGNKPIHELHGGKRVVRFLIKLAIEHSPAQQARKIRLRAEYLRRLEELRKTNPNPCVFSFEATYAKQLKVDLTPFKQLFHI